MIPTIDLTDLSDAEPCAESRQKDAGNQWEENPTGRVLILPKRKKIKREEDEDEITILENNEDP